MSTDGPESRVLTRLARFATRRAGLMIGGWLVFLVLVNTLVPQLETVVGRDSTPFVPEDAPSLVAISQMDQVFGNGKSRSFVAVVAEREGGLTAADKGYVRTLSERLAEDTRDVTFVQDLSEQRVRDTLTSKDGEAMYFQVGLPGYTGAPTSVGQVQGIRHEAEIDKPAGLNVLVTGASATVTDMVVTVESDVLLITIVTVVLIALILFVIYRSIAATALVLSIIGVALGTARGVTAFLGDADVIDVSTFSGSFLTAVLLGATTDYAIFLISRFQELRRRGVEAPEAARIASSKIGAVIVGSALTVVLATASLGLAQVGLFRTTGPPVAVSIALALAASLTLAPALLAVLGGRGWLDPRPGRGREDGITPGWQRVGDLVVRTPGKVLVGALVPLIALAALVPTLDPSFDERAVQPGDTESNRGYDVMDAHFPRNETLPDFVLITADRDMRNPHDLAVLEDAAAAAAKIPGVGLVRGVTRPTGTTITEASIGYQSGQIGDKLADAGEEIKAGSKDSQRLVDGVGQLDDGAAGLADGASRAAAGSDRILAGVEELHGGLRKLADGGTKAAGGTRAFRDGADRLADGLETAVGQTQVAVDGLGLAYRALRTSLTCGLDLACSRARDGIRQIYEGQRDQLVPGLREAAAGARALADGATGLQAGLTRISTGLATAERGSEQLAAAQRTLNNGLGQLADGSQRLAGATGQVAGGTEKLAGAVTELERGLAQAAGYLRGASDVTAGDGGFYLPASALDDERFALASGAFLSPDGRVARLIVLSETDAFGPEASARSGEVLDAVRVSLNDTTLDDSAVAITGMAATNGDIAEMSRDDFALVATTALLAVFLVLLLLIRSLVASLFLLFSVVLSFAATVGVAVLFWQILLDVPLEWTVSCIAFVILVAVGADYNLLLIKRVHEEAPDGSRTGIARALGLTGGVITAAGVIFAGSMFALMSGTITTLVQLGFTVGIGLLIDTFVVRTFVVPAFAALVGPKLWWPSKVPETSPAA